MTAPKIDIHPAEAVAVLAASWTATSIISKAVEAIVPAPVKLPAKLAWMAGRFVVASAIGDMAAEKLVKQYSYIIRNLKPVITDSIDDIVSDEDEAQ